ncbi:unnamed protein product [Menidia menidia]|uniref:(Atlantic silverside) hypothetical protein n=1 Tax=Menidia menidia TaxID=238744 RepID=A0A8S4BXJ3_9TELE|nr:unnamed protein product [Menidia menidia]
MKHDIEKLKEDVKATMKEDLSRFREEMMCELQNQKSSITETPYTKMRIFWDSGVRTYENVDETASDMIKRGFGLTWVPKENKLRSAKEKLDSLLPWKRIINTDTGQRAREKLTEFRREDQ